MSLFQRLDWTRQQILKITGFITAAVGFVVLVQNNSRLAAVVLGATMSAAIVGGAGYWIFAGSRKATVRRLSSLVFAYLVGALVVITWIVLFSVATTQRFILAAVTGSLPIPTADVLFTQFDTTHASRTYQVVARLKDDLVEQLRNHGLEEVTVAVVSERVKSASKAVELGQRGESKVVVWGRYDDLGITIRLQWLGSGGTGKDLVGMREAPWQLSEPTDVSLGVAIRDQLPADVSFSSLFVIGHLYYLANEYAKGRAAFDAAMSALREGISLENPALVHFFEARALAEEPDPDKGRVVCEYARAIKADPSFAAAYNNLGIFAQQHYVWFHERGETEDECLEDAGISSVPFFAKAVELRPDIAVFRYNRAAEEWAHTPNELGTSWPERTELEKIIGQDPTIPGAHVLLGMIAFNEGDLETAITAFTSAKNLVPGSTEIRFNLGQALLRHGEIDAAVGELDGVLRDDPQYSEALLATANVAFGRTDWSRVANLLSRLPHSDLDASADGSGGRSTAIMGAILESGMKFERGLFDEAVRVLPDTSLSHYLAGLLELVRGDSEAADRRWERCDGFPPDFDPPPFYFLNDTDNYVWESLLHRCAEDEVGSVSPAAWAGSCLPQDPAARVRDVIGEVREALMHRLYYRQNILWGGMACPYVFTYDRRSDDWRFETAILVNHVGSHNDRLQTRPLSRFDGRLVLREMEPEVTFLDSISVLLTTPSGTEVALLPSVSALRERDGQYVILRQGDELLLDFRNDGPNPEYERAQVVASGYYEPAANRE